MNEIDFSSISAEELEKLLAKKKSQERDAYAKKKQQYEADRDKLVTALVAHAHEVNAILQEFKSFSVAELENFRERAKKYGDIRAHSKGGFSLRTTDGTLKVMFERDTKSEYDERADIAEQLLKDFLGDMVKKRDQQAYEIITGLLQRGKKGDFNPAAISSLIKMEDKYTDKRWVKAMRLFKESFTTRLIAMNVSFYQQDNLGKDKGIPLSFSSLPAEPINETNKPINK